MNSCHISKLALGIINVVRNPNYLSITRISITDMNLTIIQPTHFHSPSYIIWYR